MAFNGSGVFVRLYSWFNDLANGININATRMDAETDGIATGLSNCITRDGQGKPSAAIDWNGQNLTNAALIQGTNVTATTLLTAASATIGTSNVTVENVGALALTGLGAVTSGTYAPTLTQINNISGATPLTSFQWLRVGNVVTVSGALNIQPVAGASTLTSLAMSIPVASNFATSGSAGQLAGVSQNASYINSVAAVFADAANNRARIDFIAASNTSVQWFMTFTYVVH